MARNTSRTRSCGRAYAQGPFPSTLSLARISGQGSAPSDGSSSRRSTLNLVLTARCDLLMVAIGALKKRSTPMPVTSQKALPELLRWRAFLVPEPHGDRMFRDDSCGRYRRQVL